MQKFSFDGCDVYISTALCLKSNMYIYIHESSALVIDPHLSEVALSFLQEKKIQDITIFLTHEHPDHTCGVPMLEKHFTTKLICQQACAELIAQKSNNRPVLMHFVLAQEDKVHGTNLAEQLKAEFPSYACHADVTFSDKYTYSWYGKEFTFTATPGHSMGSACIVMNSAVVFTGDTLISNTKIITRFPGGNKKLAQQKTVPFFMSLPEGALILPGHGEPFLLSSEKINAFYGTNIQS